MTKSQGQPFIASFKAMTCIDEQTDPCRTIYFFPLDFI